MKDEGTKTRPAGIGVLVPFILHPSYVRPVSFTEHMSGSFGRS